MADLWQTYHDLSARTLLGIPLTRWALFLAVMVGLFLALRFAATFLRLRLKARAERTEGEYDDLLVRILEGTRSLGLLAISAFLALNFVRLRPEGAPGGGTVERTVRLLALVVVFVQVGLWGNALIDLAVRRGFRYARLGESAARTAFGVVKVFAMVALWTSVAIVVLSAFGVEVTPLLAGLGVGGIAVGFALQRILGDIFCSVAIVLDRPFEVGDFIIAGDDMGTVERIGIRTTRVRSLGGEQIVFPNSNLIESRIHNYKRMMDRRVVFGFGVTLDTPADKLERIPEIVREIIAAIERTRLDRAHFQAIGDSSLRFEVVYYVLDADYNLFMEIQQSINLSLLRALEALGVRLAIPTWTVHVEEGPTPPRVRSS